MNTRISLFVGLMGVFGVGSAAMAACPETPTAADTNPETGHYFEVYAAPAIIWDDASACAVGQSYSGVTGHLATLTSSSEDSWVDGLRNGSGLGQVWVGGFQPFGSAEPGDGWQWVNNEGPFPGVNVDTVYANWNGAEPNDAGGIESHLTLGRYGLGGGWNDEGVAPGAIDGFIVEYDVPRPAACTGTSCQTIAGQSLSFPPEWIDDPGDTIKFSAYEFTDTRVGTGTCGTVGLNLFEFLGPSKTLYIPPYLCGSPKFVVVAVDGSDLNVKTGAVLIENDTAVVLPDNTPYECKDTKVGSTNPVVPGEDPQYQDVVVYQTTDPGNMLENPTTNPSGPPTADLQFIGAAGEFTNGCGTSRGTGKTTSYFVVGMHVDFGPANALNVNAAANHDRFVALTRYKLTLLQQSVALAKSNGALKNGDATKMSAQLANAVTKLVRGDPSGALGHVQKFLKFVNAATYNPALDNNNYNGEHLMRGTNIEFTLRVKVIPNAP
jgi:hypothetical protein